MTTMLSCWQRAVARALDVCGDRLLQEVQRAGDVGVHEVGAAVLAPVLDLAQFLILPLMVEKAKSEFDKAKAAFDKLSDGKDREFIKVDAKAYEPVVELIKFIDSLRKQKS